MTDCYYEACDVFGNIIGTYPINTDYINLFIQNKRIDKIIVICNPPSKHVMYHRNASHINQQITNRNTKS